MDLQDPGYILFVADPDAPSIRDTAGWTVQWILSRKLPLEGTVYFCPSIQMAERSLVEPLSQGEAPSLIVVDHELLGAAASPFAERLHTCVPESWIIELVSPHVEVPSDPSAFLLTKPLQRADWEQVLEHIYFRARTPQWSRAID